MSHGDRSSENSQPDAMIHCMKTSILITLLRTKNIPNNNDDDKNYLIIDLRQRVVLAAEEDPAFVSSHDGDVDDVVRRQGE